MRPWIPFVLGVVLSATTSTAFAQSAVTSLDALQGAVRAGDTVSVTDVTGREVTGRLSVLSPTSLTILVDDRVREWRDVDIVTIRQRRSDSPADGAAWGAVAGGVAAVLVIVLTYNKDADDPVPVNPGLTVGLLAGAGALIGAGIDAAQTERRVVFQRQQTSGVSFRLGAALTSTRAGMSLAIGF